jgi:ABC-type sugar transport system permease subunit
VAGALVGVGTRQAKLISLRPAASKQLFKSLVLQPLALSILISLPLAAYFWLPQDPAMVTSPLWGVVVITLLGTIVSAFVWLPVSLCLAIHVKRKIRRRAFET